jgi:RND family efflux transporter MFP subunit
MSTEINHHSDDSAPPASAPPPPGELGKPNGTIPSEGLKPLLGILGKLDWRIVAVVLLVIIAIPVWRAIAPRVNSSPGQNPPSTASLTVPVSQVTRQDLDVQVPIVAEFRPYEEVELHAKVSGYVSQMNVDFGDRVKAGQLLATLEVPELLAQLTNAIAVGRRAEAEYRAAHTNYVRLVQVVKDNPNLVAQQDIDNAEAKDGTAEAAVAAAKAEVERYQTLVSYTHITAPFAGVITHRFVDPGALIQSGTTSETQSLPLVRVSDNYRLRLDFPVEVKYVKDVHVGDPVDVLVESLGDRRFKGTITRASLRVSEATRTMTTEIEVPNPNLELVPGMYARVMLPVERHPQALAVPIDAVPPGRTNSVYVLNDKNEIEERPVTLGLDTPTKVEVITGLKEGEKVLTGRFSEVRSGQKVEMKLVDSTGKEEAEVAQKR